MIIGFSTGSLAFGNFNRALEMLVNKNVNAIELSALREEELPTLINSIRDLNLDKYKYISIHAPSKLKNTTEDEVIKYLSALIEFNWHIIVHPDVILDYSKWEIFGDLLCIENMDKRKPIGRTTIDLEGIFENLPKASFCFDLAHVRQVDSTMLEGYNMLSKFGHKLKQVHISDVNSASKHEKLNFSAILAYKVISHLIPSEVPIIIESPVNEEYIDNEILNVSYVFDQIKFEKFLEEIDNPLLNKQDIIYSIRGSEMHFKH